MMFADTNLKVLFAAPPQLNAELTESKTAVAFAASSRRIPAVALTKNGVLPCLSSGMYFLAACTGPFNDKPASLGVSAYEDKPGSTSKSSSSSSDGVTGCKVPAGSEASHWNIRTRLPDDPASTMIP